MTITLAKYGLSGDVIQAASASRGSSLGGDVERLAEQRRRRQHLAGERVLHAAAAPRRAKIISSPPEIGGEMPDALAADAGEEGGEAVEVVLAPDLERMMVALRAFEPHAEEELADHRRHLGRLAAVAEEHGRAVA